MHTVCSAIPLDCTAASTPTCCLLRTYPLPYIRDTLPYTHYGWFVRAFTAGFTAPYACGHAPRYLPPACRFTPVVAVYTVALPPCSAFARTRAFPGTRRIPNTRYTFTLTRSLPPFLSTCVCILVTGLAGTHARFALRFFPYLWHATAVPAGSRTHIPHHRLFTAAPTNYYKRAFCTRCVHTRRHAGHGVAAILPPAGRCLLPHAPHTCHIPTTPPPPHPPPSLPRLPRREPPFFVCAQILRCTRAWLVCHFICHYKHLRTPHTRALPLPHCMAVSTHPIASHTWARDYTTTHFAFAFTHAHAGHTHMPAFVRCATTLPSYLPHLLFTAHIHGTRSFVGHSRWFAVVYNVLPLFYPARGLHLPLARHTALHLLRLYLCHARHFPPYTRQVHAPGLPDFARFAALDVAFGLPPAFVRCLLRVPVPTWCRTHGMHFLFPVVTHAVERLLRCVALRWVHHVGFQFALPFVLPVANVYYRLQATLPLFFTLLHTRASPHAPPPRTGGCLPPAAVLTAVRRTLLPPTCDTDLPTHYRAPACRTRSYLTRCGTHVAWRPPWTFAGLLPAAALLTHTAFAYSSPTTPRTVSAPFIPRVRDATRVRAPTFCYTCITCAFYGLRSGRTPALAVYTAYLYWFPRRAAADMVAPSLLHLPAAQNAHTDHATWVLRAFPPPPTPYPYTPFPRCSACGCRRTSCDALRWGFTCPRYGVSPYSHHTTRTPHTATWHSLGTYPWHCRAPTYITVGGRAGPVWFARLPIPTAIPYLLPRLRLLRGTHLKRTAPSHLFLLILRLQH